MKIHASSLGDKANIIKEAEAAIVEYNEDLLYIEAMLERGAEETDVALPGEDQHVREVEEQEYRLVGDYCGASAALSKAQSRRLSGKSAVEDGGGASLPVVEPPNAKHKAPRTNAKKAKTDTPAQKGHGTKRAREESGGGDSKRQRVGSTAGNAGEGPSCPPIVDKEDVCAICQDTMWDQRTTPGALVQLGTCKHVFHSECLQSCSHQWRNHCPLCKTYYSVRRSGIRPVEPSGTAAMATFEARRIKTSGRSQLAGGRGEEGEEGEEEEGEQQKESTEQHEPKKRKKEVSAEHAEAEPEVKERRLKQSSRPRLKQTSRPLRAVISADDTPRSTPPPGSTVLVKLLSGKEVS